MTVSPGDGGRHHTWFAVEVTSDHVEPGDFPWPTGASFEVEVDTTPPTIDVFPGTLEFQPGDLVELSIDVTDPLAIQELEPPELVAIFVGDDPIDFTQTGTYSYTASFIAPDSSTFVILRAMDDVLNMREVSIPLIIGGVVPEPPAPPVAPAAPASQEIWPQAPVVFRHQSTFPASFRKVERNEQTFTATFAVRHQQTFTSSFSIVQRNQQVFKLEAQIVDRLRQARLEDDDFDILF